MRIAFVYTDRNQCRQYNPAKLYSSTLAMMAPPDELPVRADDDFGHAETPTTLRRNNSSLRLLSELTRERISLRSA